MTFVTPRTMLMAFLMSRSMLMSSKSTVSLPGCVGIALFAVAIMMRIKIVITAAKVRKVFFIRKPQSRDLRIFFPDFGGFNISCYSNLPKTR